jgi:hypothetical protein
MSFLARDRDSGDGLAAGEPIPEHPPRCQAARAFPTTSVFLIRYFVKIIFGKRTSNHIILSAHNA